MGIILDIIIILVFALFIVKNYKLPQLRCGLETGAYILSAALSVPISIALSKLAYGKLFRNALAHNIEGVIEETSAISGMHVSNIGRVMEKMPTVVQNAKTSYQILSTENLDAIDRLVSSGASDASLKVVDILAQPVLEGIFRSVFAAIFFCGLLYLTKSLAAVVENALYTQEREAKNTVLCAVFGCVKALVAVTLGVTVIQLVLPTLPVMPILNAENLGNSFLFRLFYYQNILLLFLGRDIYQVML